eukprot:TRINITY_DN1093_c1_g4_i1.p1 TRINITY_DN1093_c1_g4~~TRINITY_DN1093_c1_g4_i1.p1  ORF type:complete len:629 (-),score=189.52 TRINITY_DN1093_c1_g4_i1:30-1790(-)
MILKSVEPFLGSTYKRMLHQHPTETSPLYFFNNGFYQDFDWDFSLDIQTTDALTDEQVVRSMISRTKSSFKEVLSIIYPIYTVEDIENSVNDNFEFLRIILKNASAEWDTLEELIETLTTVYDEEDHDSTIDTARAEACRNLSQLSLDFYVEYTINLALPKVTQHPHLQEMILESILRRSLGTFICPDCPIITDSYLQDLLEHSPSLIRLDISGSSITNSALIWVANSCPLLEDLCVARCPELTQIAAIMDIGFLQMPSLQILDVSNCTELKRISIQAPHLHSLNADQCESLMKPLVMSEQPNVSACFNGCASLSNKHLQRFAQFQGSLISLTLDDCTNLSHGPLLAAFPRLTQYNVLSFSRDHPDIFDFLDPSATPKTTYVNARNRFLGDEYACIILGLLHENTKVTALDLSTNNLGPDTALALAEMLKDNMSLRHLWVDSNNFGDIGATAISKALRRNVSLERLIVQHNNIEYGGALLLTAQLCANQHNVMEVLDLRNNHLLADDARKIVSKVRVPDDMHVESQVLLHNNVNLIPEKNLNVLLMGQQATGKYNILQTVCRHQYDKQTQYKYLGDTFSTFRRWGE